MAEVQYQPLKRQNGDWEMPMMCAGRNRSMSALAIWYKYKTSYCFAKYRTRARFRVPLDAIELSQARGMICPARSKVRVGSAFWNLHAR
jgi:hypothetical protein